MKYIEKWKEIDVTDLPKEEGYCYWQEEDNERYFTQCGTSHSNHLASDFKYCPYCGKKVKKLVEVAMFIKKEDYLKIPYMVEKYILNKKSNKGSMYKSYY